MKNSTIKTKLKKTSLSLASVVFWIIVWQVAASLANKKLLFKIPLPLETINRFSDLCLQNTFWVAVGNSLLHIISGFVFGVIFGLIFGIFSGNSEFFKTLTSPVSRLIRSVPVAAFIILAWLWIPSGSIPSFISFLMVFPLVWIQVEGALLSVDTRLVEMAEIMGMKKAGIIKHIKLPTVLPVFRNSCISGLGFAWKSGVAAEVICNPSNSIGALMSGAKSNLDYSTVFAVVLTIIILSIILENIIKFVWREKA